LGWRWSDEPCHVLGGELGLGAVFGRDLRLRLVVGEDTWGELWSRIEVGGVRDLGTRRGAEQQENNGEECCKQWRVEPIWG
jgi:hypothetical protein